MNIYKFLKYGALASFGACAYGVNSLEMEPENSNTQSEDYNIKQTIINNISDCVNNCSMTLENQKVVLARGILDLKNHKKTCFNLSSDKDRLDQLKSYYKDFNNKICTILNSLTEFNQGVIDRLLECIYDDIIHPFYSQYATSGERTVENKTEKFLESCRGYLRKSLIAFVINTFIIFLDYYPDLVLNSDMLTQYSLLGGLSTYIAGLTQDLDKEDLFENLFENFYSEKCIDCEHTELPYKYTGTTISKKQKAPLALVFFNYQSLTKHAAQIDEKKNILMANSSESNKSGGSVVLEFKINFKEFKEKYLENKIPKLVEKLKLRIEEYKEFFEKCAEEREKNLKEKNQLMATTLLDEFLTRKTVNIISESFKRLRTTKNVNDKSSEQGPYHKVKSNKKPFVPKEEEENESNNFTFSVSEVDKYVNKDSKEEALNKCRKLCADNSKEAEEEFNKMLVVFIENLDEKTNRLVRIERSKIRGSVGDYEFEVLHGGIFCIKPKSSITWYNRLYLKKETKDGKWKVIFGHIHGDSIITSNKSK